MLRIQKKLVGCQVPVQFPRVNREPEGIGFHLGNAGEVRHHMFAEGVADDFILEERCICFGKAGRAASRL